MMLVVGIILGLLAFHTMQALQGMIIHRPQRETSRVVIHEHSPNGPVGSVEYLKTDPYRVTGFKTFKQNGTFRFNAVHG